MPMGYTVEGVEGCNTWIEDPQMPPSQKSRAERSHQQQALNIANREVRRGGRQYRWIHGRCDGTRRDQKKNTKENRARLARAEIARPRSLAHPLGGVIGKAADQRLL